MSTKPFAVHLHWAVRFARNLVGDIEFSPEDGYRSDMDFLCRVLEAVISEGATTINVPDTVGYAVPELYGNFIKTLRERIPNSDKAIWSVHCHNDLGMAVANSLAGVKIGGARQAHALMEDAHDADSARARAVDDDVRSDEVGKVCRRQVIAMVAGLRLVSDGLKRVIDLVSVAVKLPLAPGRTRIAQDVDEILPRLWREDDPSLPLRGGHPGPSARCCSCCR